MVIEFTDNNFTEYAQEKNKLTIIEFWAEWCGPCRMVAPMMEEIASEFTEKVNVGRVNVDVADGIAEKYGIRNIPTILFLRNGEVADRQIGSIKKQFIVEKLEKLL